MKKFLGDRPIARYSISTCNLMHCIYLTRCILLAETCECREFESSNPPNIRCAHLPFSGELSCGLADCIRQGTISSPASGSLIDHEVDEVDEVEEVVVSEAHGRLMPGRKRRWGLVRKVQEGKAPRNGMQQLQTYVR
jgi:hypothetical protein